MMLVDRAETVEELLGLPATRVILKVQVLQRIAQKVVQGEKRGGNREIREKIIADSRL